jgi:2-keto-4-pentenoate hydratase/2-oxohepta-3-ene-1,7-dioic acid hydratase in catechol pathway
MRESVVDLGALGFADMLPVLHSDTWAIGVEAERSPRIALSQVRLLAPLPQPGRIFCVGLNYRDHAVESKMEIPKVPTIFMKLPSAVIGPNESVRLPAMTQQPDYEVELAIVIGKGGRKIPKERWEEHVFGYTILNDVSARDVQLATSQWTLGKSFDTFCPIGPAIVTKDEIGDPHTLDIRLSIGGEMLQHSNTRELIFKAPELIAYLSSITALVTGDIISTGTPAGVGLGRTPQRWLKPGETMVAEIEKLGTLANPVTALE